jgi:hypothetical protein
LGGVKTFALMQFRLFQTASVLAGAWFCCRNIRDEWGRHERRLERFSEGKFRQRCTCPCYRSPGLAPLFDLVRVAGRHFCERPKATMGSTASSTPDLCCGQDIFPGQHDGILQAQHNKSACPRSNSSAACGPRDGSCRRCARYQRCTSCRRRAALGSW